MGLFGKKKQVDTTVPKQQNPQAVMMFMSAIDKGIVPKVKRLIEDEHVTSKAVIMEQCAGVSAPWRSNKITVFMMQRLGISEELAAEKARDVVNTELVKYKGLKE